MQIYQESRIVSSVFVLLSSIFSPCLSLLSSLLCHLIDIYQESPIVSSVFFIPSSTIEHSLFLRLLSAFFIPFVLCSICWKCWSTWIQDLFLLSSLSYLLSAFFYFLSFPAFLVNSYLLVSAFLFSFFKSGMQTHIGVSSVLSHLFFVFFLISSALCNAATATSVKFLHNLRSSWGLPYDPWIKCFVGANH